MPTGDERHYGRRGFLLLVGGGLSSLVWPGPVSRLLSPLTSDASQLVGNLLPVDGWRIYTISGTMPLFDPSTWRLEIDGLVKHPRSLNHDQLKALPKAEQVSTFHCVTGWTVNNVHWAGVRFETLFDLVQPLPAATAVRFGSAEHPYEDSLTLDQLRFPDAMLAYELGGEPLFSAARRAGARRVAGDVRLQGCQVVDADGARRTPAGGLLGAERLRPRRLGRALEWLPLLACDALPASRAPSERCTGSTRAPSSCCSPPGSASTCPASRN